MPVPRPLVISLRPRPALQPLPCVAAVLLIALTCWLGAWQGGRALEKEEVELRQTIQRDAAEVELAGEVPEALALDGRRIVVRGEFMPHATVYWDNRFVGKVAGMAVITPLRITGGRAVILVDRGILIPGPDRTRLPDVATPAAPVQIRGRAYLAPRRTLELAENVDEGKLWQNLTPEKFSVRTGINVLAVIVRQVDDTASSDGLKRAADVPPGVESGMTAAKHRGYAFQWYSLAALVAALFAFFTFFQYDKPSRKP